MNFRLMLGVAAILLGANLAHGQQPQHRLTIEGMEKLKKGEGKMTEEQVLKITPPPDSAVIGDGKQDDYVLTWEEVRRIRVVIVAGKVRSAEGTFSDTVKSKAISPEKFAKIAIGMKRGEVEKILGGKPGGGGGFSGSFSEEKSQEDGKKEKTILQWEQGRWMRVHVKDGKVSRVEYASS